MGELEDDNRADTNEPTVKIADHRDELPDDRSIILVEEESDDALHSSTIRPKDASPARSKRRVAI